MSACSAEIAPSQPEPTLELTGRVVDTADVLEPAFEARLTEQLANLEQDTKVQLVVATTPDLEGYDINTYSIDLARAWGLGDAERNDGLLLLVAPNERKVRIEVGLGLEDAVKDEEASLILQEKVLPRFQEGNYASGIKAGVEGLIDEVLEQPSQPN